MAGPLVRYTHTYRVTMMKITMKHIRRKRYSTLCWRSMVHKVRRRKMYVASRLRRDGSHRMEMEVVPKYPSSYRSIRQRVNPWPVHIYDPNYHPMDGPIHWSSHNCPTKNEIAMSVRIYSIRIHHSFSYGSKPKRIFYPCHWMVWHPWMKRNVYQMSILPSIILWHCHPNSIEHIRPIVVPYIHRHQQWLVK